MEGVCKMGKVYLKVMVSFEADERNIVQNPVKAVKNALQKGVEIDGEICFPMTDCNDSLYELYNKDSEINIDCSLDGNIIKISK